MNNKYSDIVLRNKKKMTFDLVLSIFCFIAAILSIVLSIVFVTEETKLFFVIFFPIIGSLFCFVVIIFMLGDYLPKKRKNDFIQRLYEYKEESFEGIIQSADKVTTLKDVGECLQIAIKNNDTIIEKYFDLDLVDVQLVEGTKVKIISYDLYISELEIYGSKVS